MLLNAASHGCDFAPIFFSKSVKQETCCPIVCIESQQNRYYTPGRKGGPRFRNNTLMLLSRGQRSLV